MTSYQIKKHFTIYIGEVLARSGRDRLTTADHSCPSRRIGVVTNMKKFAGKYLRWIRFSQTFQAASCTPG